MFEAAEIGRSLSKEEFKAQIPELRAQLLQAQFALSKTNIPVILIISGIDAAGRGEVVNALNEWLDPRGLETFAIEGLTDEERERPYYWRYWRRLPARGRIGIFFGGWYYEPIQESAYGKINNAEVDEMLEQNRRFENMLAEDGALIIKYWLHLSKDDQVKRLKKLEKDQYTRRMVSERDWYHADLYDNFLKTAERAIRHTDSGIAPWHIIEASDPRYRDITVAKSVLEHITQAIAQFEQKKALKTSLSTTPLALPPVSKENKKVDSATEVSKVESRSKITILDTLNLDKRLRGKEYATELKSYQAKLHRLAWDAHQHKRSLIAVFEGWDAAGKGGSIRRITQAMDARLYRVISSAAPTDEERAHHYLWRFWRHIPRAGNATIYDRSWYGRVLVERVEKFATEAEWKRAYLEINSFEENLAKHGVIIVKFWLHISQDEQLRRFEERQQISYKQHKITEEDWRNRDKWNDYVLAINDMVAKTSTAFAPWTLIPSNDKRYARLQVLKTVCDRLDLELSKNEKKR